MLLVTLLSVVACCLTTHTSLSHVPDPCRAEIEAFFDVHDSLGTVPGGVHVEMTGRLDPGSDACRLGRLKHTTKAVVRYDVADMPQYYLICVWLSTLTCVPGVCWRR
jgi:hypothetical protein